uniref:Peroxisomal leader peptide-processing protease n=1 Tax=Amphilophus citrinellus TaxID=61819 RepID=A0A3Q0SR34_AMPCI
MDYSLWGCFIMELKDVERSCCVVKVSETCSAKKPVSCSGVIVHPHDGTIICAGLPFSRFITDGDPLSWDHDFLPPHSFSAQLKIRVSFFTQRHQDTNQSAERGAVTRPRSKTTTGQREVAAELLMLVNCVEFKHAFQAVFQEADQWRFHCDEEDEKLLRDFHFLSWFAVLRAGVVVDSSHYSGSIPWQSSASLQKGCPVVACGSPFGSLCLDLFISTLSRGIISNLAGEDNAVILTDARCLPGTEGGGLFVMKGADSVHLIGLIVSPFGWKANEWIGLTLVCSAHLVFRNIISCISVQDPLRDVWLHRGESGLQMSTAAHGSKAIKYPTVCFVDSGQFWGSGVVVTSRLVVTCRHVVNRKSKVHLKVHDTVGDVLFSTKASSPYDLALVQLRDSVPEAVVPRIIIFMFCGPSLTCGVLSKAISWNCQPVMLQTTCAVQAGTSGENFSVILCCFAGIVSSNTRDLATKVTYPHLNFSIPVTVFQRLLQHFEQTKDINVFSELDTTEKEVRRVWRLQGAQSKL